MSESPCVTEGLSSLRLPAGGAATTGGAPAGATTPDGFATAPTSRTCRSAARCGCSGVYQAQNPYTNRDKCSWIEQLDLSGNSKGAGTGAGSWDADVFLDCVNKQITVTHKMRFVNLTGHRKYGVELGIAAPLNDADFRARTALIPKGIKDWWNAKPYRIRIKDRVCGDNIYKIYFNPVEVTSGEHYRIDLYNVPYKPVPGSNNLVYFANGDRRRPLPPRAKIPHPKANTLTLGRSYISNGSPRYGSWSLADNRTCTDTHGPGHTGYHNMLEPHEFAHMLGLKDAYYDDTRRMINGLRFHTRGDIGSAADDYVVTGTATASHPGMLGSMRNFTDYHKAYALTVAFVVIRYMDDVWGHTVEDWEILD